MRKSEPIFIHGILKRSGTNFLRQLLRLHPDVAAPRGPIYEDGFLTHSDGLFQFVERARSEWNPRWGFPEDIDNQLLGCLGDGLVSFLASDPQKRLVVKNPGVRHLDRFFVLFRTARLIILLRDGRSVVQSGMESFGWDLADGAQRWAEAADAIAAFSRASSEQSRFLIVRYEDLLTDLRPQMERILDFCELDRSSFDFERAAQIPVYGSSEFFGPGRNSLHWKPVERDDTFDPSRRWRNWSSAMHDEFWAIAGSQMRSLGYTDDAPPSLEERVRQDPSLRLRFRRPRIFFD